MKTVFQLLVCLFFFVNVYSSYAQNLEQRVAECEKQINILKSKPGIPGPKGEKGDQGVRGERGGAGSSADLGCLDINPSFLQIKYSGKNYAFLGRSSADGGLFTLSDKFGKTKVYLGTDIEGEGSILRMNNNQEKEIVYLGMTTSGEGMLKINGQVKDLAESFEIAERKGVIPGTVMTMKTDGAGTQPAKEAYDKKVVGVVSEAGGLSPGMVLGSRADGSNDLPIAIAGQVYVRVNLEGGDIAVGDLLVSSGKPGVAMKASDPMKAFGATVGKALAPFMGKDLKENGEGLLLMLVMNH